MKLLTAILLCLSITAFAADAPANDITFSALRYERDLKNQTSRGIGKAWVKRGELLLEADELEIDYKTNEALATGNVHFRQGKVDIYSERGSYALSGEKATMYNATVINEKMVFTGKVIRRLSRDYFEMEEGLYTNCNTQPVLDRSVNRCYFDWKIYGRRFDILVEGYLNAYDAILYAKDLPVTYLPYYRAPAKAKRQSGFLYPQFIAKDDWHGSGVSIPYFWAISDWNDITLSPDFYSKVGYHIGTNYRYAYSRDKAGELNYFFTQKRFAPYDTAVRRDRPEQMFRDSGINGGLLGEWALTLGNSYNLGGEDHTLQNLALVSDPFYPRMFETDLGTQGQMGYLRSQVSATFPRDSWLYTGLVRYDQSLIMTKDTGTDKGPVGQLPALAVYRRTSSLLNYFSYDFDARLNNYYRFGRGIDKVPNTSGTADTAPDLDPNDYIREGRRLQLEPRLVLNLPVPRGFEIQPELKTGMLLYHFDYGDNRFVDREYMDFQVPLALYLSKRYGTDISGLEEVRHVFQPILTYANSIYRSPDPSHQFFYNGRNTSSSPTTRAAPTVEQLRANRASPRFDILDYVQKYHYGRIDFKNALSRRIATGYEQFLTFSIGQQYNIELYNSSDINSNNTSYPIGPIESSLQVNLGRFTLQAQASYPIETSPVYADFNDKSKGVIDTIHALSITSTLAYAADSGSINLGTLYRRAANPKEQNSAINLTVVKTLPTFFDISAAVDYYPFRGRVTGFGTTLNFAAKPYSCWKLDVTYKLQEDSNLSDYINAVILKFGLSFGGNVVFGL